MSDKKVASFTDLNFDSLIPKESDQNKKIVPKRRFSNAMKCIFFAVFSIGAGIGLFFLL